MTAHAGNLIESLIQAEVYQVEDTRPAEIWRGEGLLGVISDGTVTLSTEGQGGDLPLSTWDLLAEDKLYLSPTEIDAGLIGNDLAYEIEIWNAGEETISLTNIAQSNSEGFVLDIPTPPIPLTGETVYTYGLTILKEGPPVQSTTLTFTFSNGDIWTIEISGKRLEVFPYECDASSPVQMNLGFQTVIAKSNKYVEQRRSLTPEAIIKMEAVFWFELLKSQNFLFRLRTYADMLLAVPIYVEEFSLLSDPEGTTLLVLNDPDSELQYCWFFEHSSYVLLLNLENPFIYELLEIVNINTVDSEITVGSSVSKSFPVQSTGVFPALLSFCPEITSAEHVTSEIVKYALAFEEYKD